MAWCEYLIKCYAWSRMEKEKWRKVRTIAFNAMIGSHLDPKKLPKSEEAFMPLENKKKRVDPAIMEELRREREEALKKINKDKQEE